MQLKPIHGFDYFRVLLCQAYSGKKPIYYYTGKEVDLKELAHMPFGKVLIMFDKGQFYEGEVTLRQSLDKQSQ